MEGALRICVYMAFNMPYIALNYKQEEIEVDSTKGLSLRHFVPRRWSTVRKKQDKGIVVVIPGGPKWRSQGARVHGGMLLGFLNGYDMYVMGHNEIINLHDMTIIDKVRMCINKIKTLNPGKPIHVVGSSVGGYVLAWYLALGYDQADRYYVWSSCIDIESFYCGVQKIFWLNRYMEMHLRQFLDDDVRMWRPDFIVPHLAKKNLPKKLRKRDLSKVTVIYGERDWVCENTPKHYKGCNATLVEVADGYHCCVNTVCCVSEMIKRYKNGS